MSVTTSFPLADFSPVPLSPRIDVGLCLLTARNLKFENCKVYWLERYRAQGSSSATQFTSIVWNLSKDVEKVVV